MEVVKLTFPPDAVLTYTKKILADAIDSLKAPDPKDRVPQQQIWMLEDIVKMVEVAQKAMRPTTIPQNNN